MVLRKIVSGGQTGVDRAALDVALEFGIPCGGWCPKGRVAEDGRIDERYPLVETPSAEYAQRTEWNVRDADGTCILTRGPLTGGTAQTVEYAKALNKPYLMIDLEHPGEVADAQAWLTRHAIHTLNVAGPRESKHPRIYHEAAHWLRQLISEGRRA